MGTFDHRVRVHHYKYESGRERDMPLASFSPRKTAIVLYGMTGFSGSEALLAGLGPHRQSDQGLE